MKRRGYTEEEQEILRKNPYTYKVTSKQIFFTVEFKRGFWASYLAGEKPRKILSNMGYDPDMFSQRAVDSLVQRIKKEAAGSGFREGPSNRFRERTGIDEASMSELMMPTPENMQRIWNEVVYLRQQVEFIKKVHPAATKEIDG